MNPFRQRRQRHEPVEQKRTEKKEFLNTDFPELISYKTTKLSDLNYMKASTQPKEEEVKENPLLPGWAYLSYDKNQNFQIIYGPIIQNKTIMETPDNNETVNQMNKRWKQNIDNFIEMNGIDAYMRVYGNYYDNDYIDETDEYSDTNDTNDTDDTYDDEE